MNKQKNAMQDFLRKLIKIDDIAKVLIFIPLTWAVVIFLFSQIPIINVIAFLGAIVVSWTIVIKYIIWNTKNEKD